MHMHMAIQSVGKDIVIIKDNKIIAKGQSVTMRGDDFVSIKLKDEYVQQFFNKFSPKTLELFKAIGHLRYFPTSGYFCSLPLDFEKDEEQKVSDEIEEMFSASLAVDHFNLRYRMVPDYFKDSEDYGNIFNKEI